jgi:hypothetical protein
MAVAENSCARAGLGFEEPQGMRDRGHSYRKPKDTIRIAFIGDSFTEAEQVALEDDFVSVVEQRLGTCPRLRGKNVEALNFGCDSYGTAQEFITLQRYVWKYSPDIIVLLFFAGNDLRNNSLDLEWHTCQPFYLLQTASCGRRRSCSCGATLFDMHRD